MKNLVIVESPAKAKTIEKFLGTDFIVKSSYGHIRDLVRKGMGIDIEHNFTPIYEVPTEKKKVVSELKQAVKKADTVWLATDEDREGEAIAWHLAKELKLDINATKRIVFFEITASAIKHAIKNPRLLNIDLVNAQQTRRIIDRLVGFEISPVLWRKISTGLSAGRVQSVAVRLVVDREREIQAHKPSIIYKSEAVFNKNIDFKAKLNDELNREVAEKFMQAITTATFTVDTIDKKQAKRSPSAPFTTSTLQQTAAKRLSFSVKQTMMVSQRLYEAGHITYMRTDSVNLAEEAIAQASNYIKTNFGEKYLHNRKYKTKNKSAQEAHEAIRPTNFNRKDAGNDANQKRLYSLIWQRALATQMADAKIARTQVKIVANNWQENYFQAVGEIIEFNGFLKLYNLSEDNDSLLPAMQAGEKLKLVVCRMRENFSRPPPRYNESALVKILEENGIGRPSTYAPTISTIQDRAYVLKDDRAGKARDYRLLEFKDGKLTDTTEIENVGVEKNKLFPTDTGIIVNDFLVDYFKHVVDYDFTAKLENEFDLIAKQSSNWQNKIAEFYKNFHPLVDAVAKVERSEVVKARVLGVDIASNRTVSVRLGKYGAFVQMGTKDDEVKPVFASLLPSQNLATIELQEALKLFTLPRVVGVVPDTYTATSVDGTEYTVTKGQKLLANRGPFGPYINFGERLFAPLKNANPFEVTIEEAFMSVTAKLDKDAAKMVKSFAEDKNIAILLGRWGPYIHDYDANLNAKIGKNEVATNLTLAECKERIKSSGKAPFGRKKKATNKGIAKATSKT